MQINKIDMHHELDQIDVQESEFTDEVTSNQEMPQPKNPLPTIFELQTQNANKEKIAQILLEMGYDIDRVSNSADNVLHLAVKKQNAEAVKLCLEYGIDPNRTNSLGETPLHLAAMKKNSTICEMLITAGSRIDIKNTLDQTAYHKALAQNCQEVMNLLVEHGYQSQDPFKDKLIAQGLNPDHVDNAGNTVIHRLVKTKNLELLKKVIISGFDVWVPNKKGETPMTVAIRLQDLEMVKALDLKPEAVQHGQYLCVVAQANWIEGLEYFLEKYPNPQQSYFMGSDHYILFYSKEHKNKRMEELLIIAGANPVLTDFVRPNPNYDAHNEYIKKWGSDRYWEAFGDVY